MKMNERWNLKLVCKLHLILLLGLHEYHCFPLLRHVHIITRHGDRSATVPYPNDPYQETIWPQGTGQLTQEGMRQMFRLGQFIRQRYKGFLNEKYDHHEFSARSTDRDRTLMSAQSLLAGLFPPSDEQVWNGDILWQPIPVHTIPVEEDKILEQSLGGVPCPRHMQLIEETRKSQEYEKENATFKDIYEYVLPHSGFTPPMTPILMWNVWDTLNTQRLNNYTLPSWVTEEVMTVIPQQVIPFEYKARYFPVEKSRLLAGGQLWTITNNMFDWINGNVDRRLKVHLFSSHDDNIETSLIAFGAYYNSMIPYASALFIELHEKSTDQYAVTVTLKNQTDSETMYNITIPGCDFMCPLEKFVNLTAQYSLSPDDHDTACQAVQSLDTNDIIAIGAAVLGFLLLVLGVVFIYYKRHGRRSKKGYSAL